jgi:CheY-like chemotaxis protein
MNKTRILMVDDNVLVARLIGTRLEKTERFTVRVESIPQNGLTAAREFKPHVLLLDVDMPGISGPELAKKLQKEPACANVPIIFLTSLISEEEAGEHELVSNGNRYLAKSAPIEVIIRCITRSLPLKAVA